MKIKEINVENFRKHKNGIINLSGSELSIMVGNNNSGKSTYINAIKKVVKEEKFTIYDFFEGEKTFLKFINEVKDTPRERIDEIFIPYITIQLTFKVEDKDSEMYAEVLTILDDYISPNKEFMCKVTFSPQKKQNGLIDFIKDEAFIDSTENKKKILNKYYGYQYELGNDLEMEEVPLSMIDEIINLKVLEANLLIDQNSNIEKKSRIGQSLLEVLSMVVSNKPDAIQSIQGTLNTASTDVKEIYDEDLKSNLIEVFKKFGYKTEESGELKIDLNIVAKDILSNSFKTFLTLGDSDNSYDLPDSSNGLGYNNLLLTLVEIYTFISCIETSKTPINLLCIEEPETHMHPEMERKFIERISDLKEVYLNLFNNEEKERRKNKIANSLQMILTTHSPNVVSNANYQDLIFIKDSCGIGYNDLESDDKFAIQYLTIEKTDALFSQKIILVEGDVERILVPYFIKKLGLNNELYSIVQIDGTHFKKFLKFYEKIGARLLIITDLDLKDRENKQHTNRDDEAWKCSKRIKDSEEYNKSSNNFLLNYFNEISEGDETIEIMDIAKNLDDTDNDIKVVTQKIIKDDATSITVGRTFEEQFILENKELISIHFSRLESINNYKHFTDEECNNMSANTIENNAHGLYRHIERNNKKTKFTFDVISLINDENFIVPNYIEEGLRWLLQ